MACATDLRTSRIPNLLTFSAAAAGLAWHAFGGWAPLASALGGLALGLLLFLPIYLLRGMGAGDVKLLAALGAWLGPGEHRLGGRLRRDRGRRARHLVSPAPATCRRCSRTCGCCSRTGEWPV